MKHVIVIGALCALAACFRPVTEQPGADDAGARTDAGAIDAGEDAGAFDPHEDVGARDAGVIDPDAGVSDGGNVADGGSLGAARWTSQSPAKRRGNAMAWDSQRQRVVLFGGGENNVDFSDTWEWSGTAWVELRPPVTPPPRQNHAMAYDSARQRLVMFGGMCRGAGLADTWEFDGNTWIQRFPVSSPPEGFTIQMAFDTARQRTVLMTESGWTWEWDGTTWSQMPRGPLGIAPIAYDELRQRVVVFRSGETWEWDGRVWVRHTPSVKPPDRGFAATAFDSTRQRVVLFGGDSSAANLNDTWEWDGTTWSQGPPSGPAPAPRGSHAMAFDRVRGAMVLFGGGEMWNYSAFADTWERVGTTWVERSAPPLGRVAPMAFDVARQRMVVFGGQFDVPSTVPNPMPCLNETLEWGGAWARRFPLVAPGARCFHAISFDRARARTVLFGGEDDAGIPSADTWEWDGSAWLQRTPAVSPPARSRHAMAYDEARARTVLFGGWNGAAPLADVWEWDGTDWRERLPPVAPPAQRDHGMTYDATRRVVVLVGTGGTWEWDGTSWDGGVASPPRPVANVAWDPVRRRTVAYSWAEGNFPVRQLWEWDGVVWLQTPLDLGGAFPLFGTMAWDPLSQRMMIFNGDTWFLDR